MSRLSAYFSAAGQMSPALLAAKIARRAGIHAGFVQRAELLHDPKAKQPDRLAELLDKLLADAANTGAAPISLEGRRILEIGSGPLGGLGPTAAVDGAAGYMGVDPGFREPVFRHPAVEAGFLRPALAAISRMRKIEPDTAALSARYKTLADYFTGGLEDLPIPDKPYDLVLSISCLEHIVAVDDALARLKAVTSEEARQVHLVNFSNHTDKNRPFAEIYESEPEHYRRTYGNHINLMRAPEIEDAFRRHGFDARIIPLDRRPDALPARIDPWWEERYDRDVLAVRTALLLVN